MIKKPNSLLNEELLSDGSGEVETWIILKYSDSTYTAISDDMDEVYGSSVEEIRKKIEKHAHSVEGYDLKVGSIELNDKPQAQVVGEVNVTYLYPDKLEESKKSDTNGQLRESLGSRKYNKIMKFINECVKEGIEVELTIPKKKLEEDTKMPGYYGESIFAMLDEMSGDQIQMFMNEFDLWEPLNVSKGASTDAIYDAINRYLDTDPGYGLYNRLSKFN